MSEVANAAKPLVKDGETVSIDDRSINAIRFLAVDMVEQANSGHPGAPMGTAAFSYVLWDRFLKHDPANPAWPDRDRFVLSAGHASALLYGLLHLTGYDLSLDELKQFRQWGSKTPGHPEHGHTVGVETTTGPLGQGFANAVGMAAAEASLAARYNRPGHTLVDHHTYVLASDGDMQEGVASEAASFAGMQKLGKLIVLYDDNHIQIDGPTEQCFTENVPARFEAYGWHVQGPIDGHDLAAVEAALAAAKAEPDRPSFIACRTTIGFGSPNKADSASSHGAPLGTDEVIATRAALGWSEPAFHVPDDVIHHMGQAKVRGEGQRREWDAVRDAYAREFPAEAAQFEAEIAGALPEGWESALHGVFEGHTDPIATRKASGKVLNALAGPVAALMGGSADLAGSNNTRIGDTGDFSPTDRAARNIHFGVREHAMASIATGMTLHGGIIPYVGTFLVFADYMRPAIRLAALMNQRVVYVFTHDSIGLGEDGPTHQPVEHLAALRAIPGLHVIRPADAAETREAWRMALHHDDGPTAIVLTRQSLPCHPRVAGEGAPSLLESEKTSLLFEATGLQRGAYTIVEADGAPELALIATGSEVHLAVEAARQLEARGVATRVVSMPCWELFRAQPAAYRASVLPPSLTKRLAIEAGVAQGWGEFVGAHGDVMSIETFGASAPAKVLFEQYGFRVDHVVERAMKLLERA